VACARDRRGHRGFWWVDLMERDHFDDLGENNIKMDLEEVGWGGMDCITVAQGQVVGAHAVMNLRVP